MPRTIPLSPSYLINLVSQDVQSVSGAVAALNVSSTATGGISSTNVQAALVEIDTKKAPLASPSFTGVPLVPTAGAGLSNTQAASTAFVTGGIASAVSPLATTAALNSAVSPLATTAAVNSAVAPLATTSALNSAIAPLATTSALNSAVAPLATTAALNSAVAPLATTASVNTAIAPLATSASVTSAIAPLATTAALTAAVSPLAPLASPTFTGTPAAPTAATTVNSTQIATTGFVQSLTTAARTLAVTGDVTGSITGSPLAAVSLALTHVASGVTAGTYNSLTVNAKGLVTSASVVGEADKCGRLILNSTTKITFIPFNGNTVVVNGTLATIPSAGLTISNSGLAASTIYFVYMTTAPALLLSTTSYTFDGYGRANMTGDVTKRLVGMIWTDSGSNFSCSASYFNRRRISNGSSVSGSTGSSNYVCIGNTLYFLCWADEQYRISFTGKSYSSGGNSGCYVFSNNALDGNQVGNACYSSYNGAWGPISAETYGSFSSDGIHYAQPYGAAYSGGTATWAATQYVDTWG